MIIYIFWFFALPFFQKKHKVKQSRDQNNFLLMMTIHKAKSPTQVHFRLERDERIFLKKHKTKKQTHYFEQRVKEGTSTMT